MRGGGTGERVCPTCGGTGRVEVARCVAVVALGRQCRRPSRRATDPDFVPDPGDVADLPADYMDLCAFHCTLLSEQIRVARGAS